MTKKEIKRIAKDIELLRKITEDLTKYLEWMFYEIEHKSKQP